MRYGNTQLFIDGQWRAGHSGRTMPVFDPATDEEIGRVAHADLADLESAVIAAQKGFETWRALPAVDRSRVMRRAADVLRSRADHLARVLTLEQGKPLQEAQGEVRAAASIIEWFADEGLRVYGRIVPSRTDPSIRQLVVHDPVGPVAAFTPWNFPINQLALKISASLAAGCSIVAKAAEETPAAPAALVQAFVDAGLPEGVLGLVYGDPSEISTYLITHPAIRKITFTGSTAVGKRLAALAGAHMKRTTMELGGHAPVIVCEDADVEQAVTTMGTAKFRNAGQVCTSPTRFLVHESVSARFAQAFSDFADALRVGNGMDEAMQMGPLANSRRLAAMSAFVDDARNKGAALLSGGARIGERGNFWAPTVLANVPLDADVFNDEPFGPIAGIRSFQTLDEAVTEANRLPFGLAGYAFTRSLANADVLTRKLELGILWINMPAGGGPELPFGGVKDSGYGSEGGPEALQGYLNVRTIAIQNG